MIKEESEDHDLMPLLRNTILDQWVEWIGHRSLNKATHHGMYFFKTKVCRSAEFDNLSVKTIRFDRLAVLTKAICLTTMERSINIS